MLEHRRLKPSFLASPKIPEWMMAHTFANLSSGAGFRVFAVFFKVLTSSTVAPNWKMLSLPIALAISTFAPSRVPTIKPPFMANFMFPVPEASVPAKEMCWLISLAGINNSAIETLKLGTKHTVKTPAHSGVLFTTFATAHAS